MGKYYAQNNYFNKEVVNDFAKPEYFSKKEVFHNNVVSPLNKLFMKAFTFSGVTHNRKSGNYTGAVGVRRGITYTVPCKCYMKKWR